jgi:hypothetical protein
MLSSDAEAILPITMSTPEQHQHSLSPLVSSALRKDTRPTMKPDNIAFCSSWNARDDASEASGLSSSSRSHQHRSLPTPPRMSISPSRMSLSKCEIDEDFELETAYLDAEIRLAKKTGVTCPSTNITTSPERHQNPHPNSAPPRPRPRPNSTGRPVRVGSASPNRRTAHPRSSSANGMLTPPRIPQRDHDQQQQEQQHRRSRSQQQRRRESIPPMAPYSLQRSASLTR